MEDASKEFQVFLAPMRNYQQPYRETSAKHRIVPVISKIFSSTSSTFALNQRKSNVYKAMSGVSFQDTDVAEKKHTKREKRSNRRERRETYAVPLADNEKKQVIPVIPGARRSRSLTSMESDTSISTDFAKNPPEIIHPFSPIILYNQSSGRKSRYSRVKERRRSSSQVRNGVDIKKQDLALFTKNEQPVRPRRARSASRSRKTNVLASYSSENNLDNTRLSQEELFLARCEKQINREKGSCNDMLEANNHTDKETSTFEKKISISKTNSNDDVDFSVNDTDWKKYDELVTKKLDSLLKGNEEPEGGYFSLEREENEELEISSELGENFQRDNCSETIYVTQVFETISKGNEPFKQHKNFIIEESYSEVQVSNESKDVGYVDDEGLYEEIFFDNKNDTQATSIFNNESYGVSSGINIKVTPQSSRVESYISSSVDIAYPKIEQNSSSTIVYIGGHEDDSKISSLLQKTSKLCSNVPSNILSQTLEGEREKSEVTLEIVKESSFPCGEKRLTNHSAWCGCCNGKSMENYSVNHNSSCIQSKSGLLSTKYSFMGDNAGTTPDVEATKETISLDKRVLQSCADFGGLIRTEAIDSNSASRTVDVTHNKPTEPDYELSDIDLNMFAPKNINNKRFFNFANRSRSVSDTHLNLQSQSRFYLKDVSLSNGIIDQKKEITSPKTFKAFLENSIFNPPNTESLIDDTDTLVIKSDQTITCITDSSSSEEDDDDTDIDENDQEASWLEAESEFEFVVYKEEKKKFLNFARRKKSKNLISLHKLFTNSLTSSINSSSSSHLEKTYLPSSASDNKNVPERPSRRRKKSHTGKREET